MNKGVIVLVTGLVIIAAVVVIFISRNFGGSEPGLDVKPQTQQPPAFVAVTQKLLIPVTLTEQFFSPNTVQVKVGDTVTLEITAADQDHTVSAPDYAIEKVIAQGSKETVQFVADRPGQILVSCTDRCDPGVQIAITVSP